MTKRATRRDVSTQVHVPLSKNSAVGGTAPELLGQRFTGVMLEPIAEEFWCSAMRKNESSPGVRKSSSFAIEPVCGKLRLMFDDVASEPMPDALTSLADRLDIAFERGDLFASKPKGSRR